MKGEHAKRLDEQDHKALALWAADCAERVLPYFEDKYPKDDRPRKAIEAGRAWARAAAFAAHAAARAATDASARSAARAAGHAAATAHVAAHARHAAAYAVTAAVDAGVTAATERDWQYRRLPEHLRPVVFPA